MISIRLTAPISSQVAIVLQDLSAGWREPHMASTIEPTFERNGYDERCR